MVTVEYGLAALTANLRELKLEGRVPRPGDVATRTFPFVGILTLVILFTPLASEAQQAGKVYRVGFLP